MKTRKIFYLILSFLLIAIISYSCEDISDLDKTEEYVIESEIRTIEGDSLLYKEIKSYKSLDSQKYAFSQLSNIEASEVWLAKYSILLEEASLTSNQYDLIERIKGYVHPTIYDPATVAHQVVQDSLPHLYNEAELLFDSLEMLSLFNVLSNEGFINEGYYNVLPTYGTWGDDPPCVCRQAWNHSCRRAKVRGGLVGKIPWLEVKVEYGNCAGPCEGNRSCGWFWSQECDGLCHFD